jgi:hypothetical protein
MLTLVTEKHALVRSKLITAMVQLYFRNQECLRLANYLRYYRVVIVQSLLFLQLRACGRMSVSLSEKCNSSDILLLPEVSLSRAPRLRHFTFTASKLTA